MSKEIYVVNCYTCQHNGQETCKGCNTLLNGDVEPYENWKLREDLSQKDQRIAELEQKCLLYEKEMLNCSQLENGMSLCIVQKQRIAELEQELNSKNMLCENYNCGLNKKIQQLKKELAELKEKAIVVPVKLGDTIYVVPSRTNYQINIINNKEEKNKVSEFVVDEIRYNKYGYSIVCYIDYIPFYFNYETAKGYCEHFDTEQFYGETWFTTREEAQAKLKEIQENE